MRHSDTVLIPRLGSVGAGFPGSPAGSGLGVTYPVRPVRQRFRKRNPFTLTGIRR